MSVSVVDALTTANTSFHLSNAKQGVAGRSSRSRYKDSLRPVRQIHQTCFRRSYISITRGGERCSVALLFAFSVGALLRMYELNDSTLHVIEWHYLPMLWIGLIGWWMGKRALKW